MRPDYIMRGARPRMMAARYYRAGGACWIGGCTGFGAALAPLSASS